MATRIGNINRSPISEALRKIAALLRILRVLVKLIRACNMCLQAG